jgi:hypothetical protein
MTNHQVFSVFGTESWQLYAEPTLPKQLPNEFLAANGRGWARIPIMKVNSVSGFATPIDRRSICVHPRPLAFKISAQVGNARIVVPE